MTSDHKTPRARFPAEIKIRGINPYVLVEASAAQQLKRNWRRPIPVRVQINGEPNPAWPINIMPVGDGSFYLYLHAKVREASRTKVGDRVNVEVEFNEDYQGGPVHPMPPLFAEKLKEDPDAQRGWKALSPSRRKEILRYLAGLKSEEARYRNIERAMHVLAGKHARFMAREWNSQQRR